MELTAKRTSYGSDEIECPHCHKWFYIDGFSYTECSEGEDGSLVDYAICPACHRPLKITVSFLPVFDASEVSREVYEDETGEELEDAAEDGRA